VQLPLQPASGLHVNTPQGLALLVSELLQSEGDCHRKASELRTAGAAQRRAYEDYVAAVKSWENECEVLRAEHDACVVEARRLAKEQQAAEGLRGVGELLTDEAGGAAATEQRGAHGEHPTVQSDALPAWSGLSGKQEAAGVHRVASDAPSGASRSHVEVHLKSEDSSSDEKPPQAQPQATQADSSGQQVANEQDEQEVGSIARPGA